MSRSDGREIVLEIHRNVNILFDIEPTLFFPSSEVISSTTETREGHREMAIQ